MRLDFKIEQSKLNKVINEMIKLTGRSRREIVIESTEAFIRSAQREVPPAKGKTNIPRKLSKRNVIKMTDPRYPGKNKRTAYKVPYRTAKKKGRKFFHKLSEARQFSKILFRGAGRMGWAFGLPKIGKSFKNIKANLNVPASVNKVTQRHSWGKFVIQIDNLSSGIRKYAERSRAWGYAKAKNKMNSILNKYKRELKQQWQG